MKTWFALICFSFLYLDISAQAKEPEPNSPTPQIIRKNEIGLLASPVGIILLGGSPSGQRMGISYKRNNGKPYLFTGGMYYTGFGTPFPPREFTVKIDKNKREIQYNRDKSAKGNISLGMERRWPMKSVPALTRFIGAEITAGYAEYSQNVFRQWMEIDSVQGLQNPGQEILLPSGSSNLCYRKNTRTISTGLAFNAGLQYRLSERFYAMAQFSLAFEMGFQEVNEQNNLTGESRHYKASVLDFNQRGLIGDIGVYYRF